MSLPSSPAAGGQPLQPVSHNAQRESALFSSVQQHRDRIGDISPTRDSSVHEKINQFNSLAMQSKTFDRKTNEAALKRAMLGREEAEEKMRRYRDEARALRKQVEEEKERAREEKERVRIVSERLEAMTEHCGREKEQHAHSKHQWEKAIRRAQKETYKVQSSLLETKEELKSCRSAQKAAEDELQAEREQNRAREQEVFEAKSKLAELQEQLDQALGRVKMLEQELDAIKSLADKQGEVKRLAPGDDDGDNSEGPRKRARRSSVTALFNGNPDLETITMLWEWEKQRADRALEQVDFLETECRLKLCPAGKTLRQNPGSRSNPRKRASMKISDAGDSVILSESRRASAEIAKPTPGRSKTDLLKVNKEPRRSTIFLPAEGIFRTVSQAEADAIAAKSMGSSGVSPTEPAASLPITPTDSNPMYRRTPSVDPPDFAMLNKERTSLLSLLEAPHRQEPTPVFNIPTTPGPAPEARHEEPEEEEIDAAPTYRPTERTLLPREPAESLTTPLSEPLPSHNTMDNPTAAPRTRPHTTASHYPATNTTITTVTTTKVPLRSEPTPEDGPTLAQRLLKAQRTPARQTARAPSSEGDNGEGEQQPDPDRPSFDATNPALTPTMTREQALAQIRERRGRARSVGRVGSGGSSAGNNNTTSTTGRTSVASSGRGSGSGAGSGEARRKVSGGSTTSTGSGSQVVRRKASGNELASTAAAARRPGSSFERGRERVSAPTAASAAAAGGNTVRGVTGAAGLRRVRS
ncbi:hypothetical protein C7999DRAFT_30598 [Corynascus novoguineensis]|uniref:Uncharacterized protein n=1 Tax=Corynascus novoguineensis TaxID=1126955 RepID=A0AAN7CV27_9PEZI|nr:hypothetical protein C7999DRAFT_30598 [Corynascus novoguineensis]